MTDWELVNRLAAGDAGASEALSRRVARCVSENFSGLRATTPLIVLAIKELKANQFRRLRQRGDYTVDDVIYAQLQKVLADQLTNIKLIYRQQLSIQFINFFDCDEQAIRADLGSFAAFFETYFDNTALEAACVAAYYWPERKYTDAAARLLYRLASPDCSARLNLAQVRRYASQVADYRKRGNQKIRSTLLASQHSHEKLEEIFFMMDFCDMSTKRVSRKFRTTGVRTID